MLSTSSRRCAARPTRLLLHRCPPSAPRRPAAPSSLLRRSLTASASSAAAPLPTRRPSPSPLGLGSAVRRRHYATAAAVAEQQKPAPRTFAVLGGGLTGLTTAYYLARFVPDAKVTVYEATDRLGGWIDTEELTVPTLDGKDGKVLFERGGRVIKRPTVPVWNDMIYYDLVCLVPWSHPEGADC